MDKNWSRNFSYIQINSVILLITVYNSQVKKMENNNNQSTQYIQFEYKAQEAKKKTKIQQSSIEEQYYNLPLKERIKIRNKRIKQKLKEKSQEIGEKAKIKSKQLKIKSQEISEKVREKNRQLNHKIQKKIDEHKSHQNQRNNRARVQPNAQVNIPNSIPTKFCPECGHKVSFSGKFCPSCGSTQ
ncbi:hypothetical protein NEF87_001525 [Candidatus Lokiarchaeum ossiferum]|uniref:Zinc-ribbon domain-containing protein n=1 Tax=Candidatus Lokiarchaeum ossiferum TaxID=2951803 RepID=A0ABY6HNY6_9ARCH|nr:hypothetical protein NEF87_001525 [Candidatus Lokiarchaeum sp. B-35]